MALGVRLEPLTVTVRLAGVLPDVGVTVSHEGRLLAVALKLSGEPVLLLRAMVCEAGAGPPAACVKLSAVGLAVSGKEDEVDVSAVTWSTTGITTGLFGTSLPSEAVAIIFRIPLYIPGLLGTNDTPPVSITLLLGGIT